MFKGICCQTFKDVDEGYIFVSAKACESGAQHSATVTQMKVTLLGGNNRLGGNNSLTPWSAALVHYHAQLRTSVKTLTQTLH